MVQSLRFFAKSLKKIFRSLSKKPYRSTHYILEGMSILFAQSVHSVPRKALCGYVFSVMSKYTHRGYSNVNL